MTPSGKIRLLLFLLCAGLLSAALIIKKTYTPVNSLNQIGRKLEDNLHKKETLVQDLVSTKQGYARLKKLSASPDDAMRLIQHYTSDNRIWLVTTVNGKVNFWTGIKVVPTHPELIKEGHSFIREPNGYYEAIKKTEGNFSAIFLIPVKQEYSFQNQYLVNDFYPDLVNSSNIDIADFSDKGVYIIHSLANTYLFSIKLKSGELSHSFFYAEFLLWALTLIMVCVLVQNCCNYMVLKDYPFLAALALAVFIILLRILNLHYNWPDLTYKLRIFKPEYYASSYVYPSLGDMCINIFLITWFISFLYLRRASFFKFISGKAISYVIITGQITILIVVSVSLLKLFYGLVVNSKISFDVSNVLNLSFYSYVGVLMLCFSFLIFYLLSELFLSIATRLPIPDMHKVGLLITGVLIATAVDSYYYGFTFFYLLWFLLVMIRAFAYRYNIGRLDTTSFALVILICAVISSIKLNNFENVKESDARKAYIQKLEVPNDSRTNEIFKRIDKSIINDSLIVKYFRDSLYHSNYIKTRLQKVFFNGYLSKYDFKVYEFDDHDRPISGDRAYGLSVFKDMVLYSSIQVSSHFYQENETFGFQSYFAIMPVVQQKNRLGTIVIELISKPQQSLSSFPGLLIDGHAEGENDFKGYSYAFFSDDRLLTQNGAYVYDLVNTGLKGQLNKYTTKTTGDNSNRWYSAFTKYNHLIYKPSKRNLIVVTRQENGLLFGITSITFFFVVLLVFGIIVALIAWLWLRIKLFTVNNDMVNWSFKLNFDKVLYKTRIQFSMIFAVVVTLLLVGFITFFSISTHYQTQDEKLIREKITRIATAFEHRSIARYFNNDNQQNQVEFNEFANTYAADLTLFDLAGNELISTQPKIYEFGLQARRMNARAFVILSGLKRSEYINDEVVGKLNYRAAYVPVSDALNTTVAYLELPYFANEADNNERVGSLLNIMINVYALVFIAIGLFAILIARQITAPLNFIQYSLSKTIYGKKNEPIRWERNDEIGALVKEYNNMIAELENSAKKLAQSERESAWREMAKQVAHEIKNPLTPLKLGLQLLDKSWRDKDPKFDQKFERFSKSFVEQIESLSSIASEFSSFAKMPDTRLEKMNLFDVLNQAVIIFKQMDNITINYEAPDIPFFINADRDQLLRCFNNLLKNAIEAASADRPGIIEINNLITSKNILLTVKDNGKGIPENLREKIFEPNFTTKSSGTGLGLAFVKNSIENAGGKVWFETIIEQGTTFYLNLPVA